MRVAVITPYFREPAETLRRAHDSVLAQTHAATHFLVADGSPNPAVAGWNAEHIVLPKAHGDYGDTPRVIGALSALGQGHDAIAFLDADNWYRPTHIATMIAAHEHTGFSVCLASRSIHRLDGSFMFDFPETDNHVDTSCFFLTGEAVRLVPLMALKPHALADQGDRIFWGALRFRGMSYIRVKAPTVAYTSAWEASYRAAGETPPEGADKAAVGDSLRAWLKATPEAEKASWSRWLFGAPDRWGSASDDT